MILFKFMRPKKRDFRGDARKGAKIPKYIVEKILSQGGTGSAHPYRWAQLKRVRKFAQSANLMSRTKAVVGKEANINNKVCTGLEVVANDPTHLINPSSRFEGQLFYPLNPKQKEPERLFLL